MDENADLADAIALDIYSCVYNKNLNGIRDNAPKMKIGYQCSMIFCQA